jgi:hypothetical protein
VLQNKKVKKYSEDSEGKYIFSQSQLNRFNLKLPKTIWEYSEIVEWFHIDPRLVSSDQS